MIYTAALVCQHTMLFLNFLLLSILFSLSSCIASIKIAQYFKRHSRRLFYNLYKIKLEFYRVEYIFNIMLLSVTSNDRKGEIKKLREIIKIRCIIKVGNGLISNNLPYTRYRRAHYKDAINISRT